jgi:hypothetical protein
MPKWDSNPRSQCWSGRRQFVGCQEWQQRFAPSGHFLIAKRQTCGWPIFVMGFLVRNSCNLNTWRASALPWWRIYFSGQPPKGFQYSVLLLLVSRLIFDLSPPMFVLCLHLHLSTAFLATHFLSHLVQILALPWNFHSFHKHSISS